MTQRSVLVFGGGIGALSAALELTQPDRSANFRVKVVAPTSGLGGKAVSKWVPGDPPDVHGYPGEHGFRFFPSFYRHVVETMACIPSAYPVAGRATVADHLRPTPLRLLGRRGQPPTYIPASPQFWRPDTIAEFLRAMLGADLGFHPGELAFFVARLIELGTTPKAERLARFEPLSWWDFIGAQTRSSAYQDYLAKGLTHTLVAADPREINAKTGGDVLIRLLIDSGVGVDEQPDRVLDGPTSKVWIVPWIQELKSRGVTFVDAELLSLGSYAGSGRVTSARVRRPDASEEDMVADYYVCGLPVEAMAAVMARSPDVAAQGERLASLPMLRQDVRSMTGLQFYLDQPLAHLLPRTGHHLYVDSEWALTGIEQSAFWRAPFDDLRKYGDGRVASVWSVVISNWQQGTSTGGTQADLATRAEIRESTLQQLERGLNGDGVVRFDRRSVLAWSLDDAMTPGPEAPDGVAVNRMPLLINKPNRWAMRPDPAPAGLDNLLLASDYVRTNTDLATMEGANEAARRCVNAMLKREGIPGKPCAVYELYFPEALSPFGLGPA